MPEIQTVEIRPFDASAPFEGLSDAQISLREATSGGKPRLATWVALFRDAQGLTVLFNGVDDHTVATHDRHDAPLWQEDVVEIFLAPSDRTLYYEFEVNPLGATFDAKITSPDGVRQTMHADVEWNCAGLWATVAHRNGHWLTALRIPFAGLGVATPRPGDRWAANLFRVDRHPRGDEYSAWQPTMKKPADFHVAASFGLLAF